MKKTLAPFIALSLFASALNYFAYPILSRLLPSHEYVNITVALSLFTQISTFLSSLTAITIGISKDKNHEHTLHKLQVSLLQVFSIFGLLFLALSPLIMSNIHTPVAYALPIVIMILLSIPITMISGYLNGHQLMTKLGLVAILVASLQFITGVSVAWISGNGFLTMLCMGSVQILSIIILLRFLGEPAMPRTGKELFRIEKYSPEMKKILVYVIVASFAIMLINILQIFDLLAIKNMGGATAKFYADIYIVSRIVYFGGIILIWPFLGAISIDNKIANNKAFFKLIGMFSLMGSSVLLTLSIFGKDMLHILFGEAYPAGNLVGILLLSTVYKIFFLVITAACLYLIVFRSLKSVWLALFTLASILAGYSLANHSSVASILLNLTIAAGISASAGAILLLRFRLPGDGGHHSDDN